MTEHLPQRPYNEPRVHRTLALPVSAFDVLKGLQRKWRMQTNAEVVTRLLLDVGAHMIGDEDEAGRIAERPEGT